MAILNTPGYDFAAELTIGKDADAATVTWQAPSGPQTAVIPLPVAIALASAMTEILRLMETELFEEAWLAARVRQRRIGDYER